MSVITATVVEKANGVLRIGPADIVTPLARDRAKELGIRLERGPSPAAGGESTTTQRVVYNGSVPPRRIAAPTTYGPPVRSSPPVRGAPATSDAPPPLPRSGALYRRGAYGPRGARVIRGPRVQAIADARPRVVIVGAGHVGASAALQLAEGDRFSQVMLVDIVPGLAAGLALDIWHGAGVRGFTTRVEGSDDMLAVAGADIVIVTAGQPRKPGMSRTDLTAANAAIVRSIAPSIAQHAPSAVVVVVTNPLEEMTHLMCETTGFPNERVVGMGGLLDAARFRSLVGLTGVVRPEDVRALALGSHGAEMVIPLSQASANGTPLEELIDRPTLDAIVERTRESGAEVTKLLQTGSAFFSPAASIAEQVDAILGDTGAVVSACVRSRGSYGTVDTYLGLPVKLGRDGVREIVALRLREDELRALRTSAKAIDARIKSIR